MSNFNYKSLQLLFLHSTIVTYYKVPNSNYDKVIAIVELWQPSIFGLK